MVNYIFENCVKTSIIEVIAIKNHDPLLFIGRLMVFLAFLVFQGPFFSLWIFLLI